LQNSIDDAGEIVHPGRLLVKEGPLLLYNSTENPEEKPQERYGFLFNDLILICSKHKNPIISIFKPEVIYQCKIKSGINDFRPVFIASSLPGLSDAFGIEFLDKRKTVILKSSEEGSNWLNILKDTKKLSQKRQFAVSTTSSKR